MGLRPTQAGEKDLCSAATVHGGTTLPLVISTGAQRSGETCGFSGLLLGDSRSATAVPGRTALPLSSRPERSVVERSAVLSWKCFSTEAA
jgi:hypothetical protein